MAKKPKYRLQVLITLRERKKRDAEIALAKALRKLKEEQEKLKELELEKEKLLERIKNEQQAMRDKVAGGNALIKDPQVHLNFLRKLKEDLEELEKKIEEQKEEIKRAEKRVARARSDYMIAAQELNIMEQHKELWEKKTQRELTAAENKMLGELGNVIHGMNKMR